MSVTEEWLRAKIEREQSARVKVASDLDYDPDYATRVMQVGLQTGLPGEVIEADLEGLESQLKKQEFNYDKYLDPVSGSPAFAKFSAANPYSLAVLKRDEKSLTAIERSLKPLFLALDSTWARNERTDIWDRRLKAGEFAEGDEERLKELKQWQVDHDFAGGDNVFSKFLVRGAKELGPMLRIGKARLQGFMAGSVVGAGTGLYSGTPWGVLAGWTGGGLIGGWTGGYIEAERMMTAEQFGNLMELQIPEQTARIAARAHGAVAGVMESFGVGGFMRNVPGLRGIQSSLASRLMGDVLSKPTVKMAMVQFGVRTSETLLTEIGTEVMQTSTEIISENFAKMHEGRDDLVVWDEYVDAVADTVVQTFWGVGLLAVSGPSIRLRGDMYRASEAKNTALAWKAVGEGVKNSQTKKDLPKLFRNFVDSIGDDVKHLLIDVDRFDTYFQDQGMDPDEVAKSLGIEQEAIDSARELGTKLEMPVGAYAEKIAGTEAHAALTPDLKTDLSKMSIREAEEFEKIRPELEKELNALIAPVDDAASAEKQRMLKDITAELVAAGTEPGLAQQQAQFMLGLINLDEKMGFEPGTLFRRFFAGVRRDLPEGVQDKDFDIVIDPLLNKLRTGEFPTQREMMGPSLMDLITESGGIDLTDPELVARDFELVAAELGISKAELKRWRESGRSIDDIAELAAEQGYIASRDENLLLEALEAEIRGQPVFGRDVPGDPVLQELGQRLEELASFIQAEGIDLDTLSNAEVRELLEAGDKFEQIDFEALAECMESQDLAQMMSGMPHIFEQQDFGDLQFTDRVRVLETGETGEVTENVQTVFDEAIQRRNGLRKLLGCVSG